MVCLSYILAKVNSAMVHLLHICKTIIHVYFFSMFYLQLCQRCRAKWRHHFRHLLVLQLLARFCKDVPYLSADSNFLIFKYFDAVEVAYFREGKAKDNTHRASLVNGYYFTEDNYQTDTYRGNHFCKSYTASLLVKHMFPAVKYI